MGYAEAGPYVARVVWLDGDRESVVAEAHGWVGSPDAPVVVLEGLQSDPPTPRVGEPATVSVTVTNQGQTPGSRNVPLWVWLDQQTYRQIGTLDFDDVAPGETRTENFTWTPKDAVTGTRLGARTSVVTEGLVLAPFRVAPTDDPTADAPE